MGGVAIYSMLGKERERMREREVRLLDYFGLFPIQLLSRVSRMSQIRKAILTLLWAYRSWLGAWGSEASLSITHMLYLHPQPDYGVTVHDVLHGGLAPSTSSRALPYQFSPRSPRPFSQHILLQLSRRRLGQFINNLDLPRNHEPTNLTLVLCPFNHIAAL